MAPPNPSPQVIGTCAHCRQKLYSGSPVVSNVQIDIELMEASGLTELVGFSHVACAVFALRDY